MEVILYYFLPVVGFIIVLIAQLGISISYKTYSRVRNDHDLTGASVARKILDANGLDSIRVVKVSGELTDHYDPNSKVVRLSESIYSNTSISSMAVAAHECGHAIQDKEGYSFMRIRSALVPIVNFVSYLGYFGLIVSIIGGLTGYLKLSLLVLLVTLLFQIVTLPVEFDASRRAKKELNKLGLVSKDSLNGVRKVLFSAAMTYVASVLSNVLQILRILILFRGNDD